MMGLAIAHQIKEQVVFVQEPINVPSQHHFTIQEKIEVEYDYGEQIVVI
jgi:hypothetical protein